MPSAADSARSPVAFWLLTASCAMAPDLDTIGFAFGVPYDDVLGHRGVTHSIAFAAVAGLAAARFYVGAAPPPTPPVGAKSESGRFGVGSWPSGIGSWPLGVAWLYFSLVTMSHGVLDAFTDGGRGIALLWPFSPARFFFPWRPIRVSPIGIGFFSPRGLVVLASELRWIVLPSAISALIARAVRTSTR